MVILLFECVQLQSVQYTSPSEKPIDLRYQSLEEIVGGRFNWFSIKQKDICMAKRQQVSEHGSPSGRAVAVGRKNPVYTIKAVSKWYLYQEERHLIEDPTTEAQQDYETGDETDENMESIGVENPMRLLPSIR